MPNANLKRTEEDLKKATEEVDAAKESAAEATEGASEEKKEGAEKPDLTELLKDVSVEELLKVPAVDSAIKSRVSTLSADAVKAAKAGWQEEADAMSAMSDEEKAKYLFDKEKRDFDKEKTDFNRERRAVQVRQQLEEAGLPDLSIFITGDDDESTKNNIAAVTSILNAWKAKQLAEVMRGETPKAAESADTGTLTADDIRKMSRAEIREALRAGRIDYSKL